MKDFYHPDFLCCSCNNSFIHPVPYVSYNLSNPNQFLVHLVPEVCQGYKDTKSRLEKRCRTYSDKFYQNSEYVRDFITRS